MSFTALTFSGLRLNFTQNCSASSQFIADYSWGTGPAFFATYQSVYRDVLAALPKDAGTVRPSECDVLSWFKRNYESPNSTYITSQMYRTAFDACIPETCPKLSLKGNADIAGIGMLAAYLMEAVMVTIYTGVLLWGIWRSGNLADQDDEAVKIGGERRSEKGGEGRGESDALNPPPPTTTHPEKATEPKFFGDRLTAATILTVDDFLDTTLFFALAIILAGIVMTPSSRRPYELLQATLASALTLSASLAIWSLRASTMRRRRRRDSCLAVLIALALVQTGMVIWTGKANEDITRREYNCLREVFASMTVPSAFFVIVQALTGLAAVLVLGFMLLALATGVPRRRRENTTKTIGTRVGVVVCVYGLVNVWLMVGTLFWLRRLVRANMILSSDERGWGFGQVVALSSWLPTQLSFLETLICKFCSCAEYLRHLPNNRHETNSAISWSRLGIAGQNPQRMDNRATS